MTSLLKLWHILVKTKYTPCETYAVNFFFPFGSYTSLKTHIYLGICTAEYLNTGADQENIQRSGSWVRQKNSNFSPWNKWERRPRGTKWQFSFKYLTKRECAIPLPLSHATPERYPPLREEERTFQRWHATMSTSRYTILGLKCGTRTILSVLSGAWGDGRDPPLGSVCSYSGWACRPKPSPLHFLGFASKCPLVALCLLYIVELIWGASWMAWSIYFPAIASAVSGS